MKQQILQLGGPHLKICPWCQIEFLGRNNQKYCCNNHRAYGNSKLKTDSNHIMSPILKRMKRNHEILMKFLPISKGEYINLSDLIRVGFDANSASNEIKRKDNNEIFYCLGDLAYKINDTCTEIKIIKWKKYE